MIKEGILRKVNNMIKEGILRKVNNMIKEGKVTILRKREQYDKRRYIT